jgi:hypothetical protein
MPAQSPTLSPTLSAMVALDLADQVGADVGGLGEDAAAHPHEHGDQGGAEAEALQHLRRVGGVHQHHTGGAQQAEPHREHADDAARAKCDLHRGVRDGGEILSGFAFRRSGFPGRRGDPYVAAHGEPHADIAGGRRERRADQEEHRAAGPLIPVVRGQQHEQEEHGDGEYAERAQLPGQIRLGTFLDRLGDPFHAFGALARREHLPDQDPRDHQRGEGDRRDNGHDDPIVVGQNHGCERSGMTQMRGRKPRHSSSLTLGLSSRCGRIVGTAE